MRNKGGKAGTIQWHTGAGWRALYGVELLSALPPHPNLLPWGEGIPLSRSQAIYRPVTQFSNRAEARRFVFGRKLGLPGAVL